MASILTIQTDTNIIVININAIKYIKFDTKELEQVHNYLEINFGNAGDENVDLYISTNYTSLEVLKQLAEIIITMMGEATDTTKINRRISITKDAITEISSRYYLNK